MKYGFVSAVSTQFINKEKNENIIKYINYSLQLAVWYSTYSTSGL
jgi:hypothetical protein